MMIEYRVKTWAPMIAPPTSHFDKSLEDINTGGGEFGRMARLATTTLNFVDDDFYIEDLLMRMVANIKMTTTTINGLQP